MLKYVRVEGRWSISWLKLAESMSFERDGGRWSTIWLKRYPKWITLIEFGNKLSTEELKFSANQILWSGGRTCKQGWWKEIACFWVNARHSTMIAYGAIVVSPSPWGILFQNKRLIDWNSNVIEIA